MERLQNLSAINTNTIEGRLLIAAMVKISTESQTDKNPDEILQQCYDLAENIYKDVKDIETMIVEPKTFKASLVEIINKYSMENGSDTPDFILAKYLESCLQNYNEAVKARDKWFGVNMWEINKEVNQL